MASDDAALPHLPSGLADVIVASFGDAAASREWMSELLDDSSRGRAWVDHEGIRVPPDGHAALCQHWRGSERGRQGLLQSPGHKLERRLVERLNQT